MGYARTLSHYLMETRRIGGDGADELKTLLLSISLAVKVIARLVWKGGLPEIFQEETRMQGDLERLCEVDEQAEDILIDLLQSTGNFGLLMSEERDAVEAAAVGRSDTRFVAAFDPLDGLGNLGSNVPVGTIFAVFRKKNRDRPGMIDDFYQSGRRIAAAGYAIYGAKTTFVFSCGKGVQSFTLDWRIGDFVLTDEELIMPSRAGWYSVNEGYAHYWPAEVTAFLEQLKSGALHGGEPYMSRYVGSLVVDFDRTLRNGGIYLYPVNSRQPKGKLRLLYQCMPLAYIAEQAGGRAVDGARDILDARPQDIHDRCAFIAGGSDDVEAFMRVVRGAAA